MIISDRYRLAFVHIPKCAGTSVRTRLQELDDSGGAHTNRVGDHPTLGVLDYVHIPLFTLRDHFGAEYDKVRGYWSFSVVRDPFSRFPSSISQRFRMYGGQPIQKLGIKEIKREIDNTINYLSARPRDMNLLPAEYIHFQKQVNYIFLDGEQVVDTIYPIERIGDLLEDVGLRVGRKWLQTENVAASQANCTVVYRSDLVRRVIESTRPVTRSVRALLPESAKQYIRTKVYVPRDRRLNELFSAGYIRDFIHDYYAEDIRLTERVNADHQGSVA